MKLRLAVGILTAAALAACGGSTSHYVMRVDRTFDRSAQPQAPSEELPANSYRPDAPTDRWDVAIDGSKVVLTAIGSHATNVSRLEGKEVPAKGRERRFDLEGVMGGGRFVVHGDEAELTMFGSGVPIVSSERGKLVTR